MKNQKFTEDPDILLELTNTMKVKDIAKLYNVERHTITRQIKSKYPNFNHALKYIFNYDYFKQVDTEDKAYWLGFLYADGNVNQQLYSMKLELQYRDIKHINKFKSCIKSECPITTRTRKLNDKFYKMCAISISNSAMCKDLNNLGCVPKKSWILEFPSEQQVPKGLLRHFLRGYMDGDGHIGFPETKKISVSFVGNHNFLFKLRLHLFTHINLPSYQIRTAGLGKISNLRYTHKCNCLNLLNYMYKDSTVYLDRKYETYLKFVNHVDSLSIVLKKKYRII